MPQEFLTAVALLVPGIAAGLLYAAKTGPSAKAWAYLGYAAAFSVIDLAFVMGMVLLIRGQDYMIEAGIDQVENYLFVLLLALAGAAALYILMRLKDLVVRLIKGLIAAIFGGNENNEKE